MLEALSRYWAHSHQKERQRERERESVRLAESHSVPFKRLPCTYVKPIKRVDYDPKVRTRTSSPLPSIPVSLRLPRSRGLTLLADHLLRYTTSPSKLASILSRGVDTSVYYTIGEAAPPLPVCTYTYPHPPPLPPTTAHQRHHPRPRQASSPSFSERSRI